MSGTVAAQYGSLYQSLFPFPITSGGKIRAVLWGCSWVAQVKHVAHRGPGTLSKAHAFCQGDDIISVACAPRQGVTGSHRLPSWWGQD